MKIQSIIDVAGHRFNMSGERGYGLINLTGNWTLIQFTALFETMPPQGNGIIIGQNFNLEIKNGQLTYLGQTVHTEVTE